MVKAVAGMALFVGMVVAGPAVALSSSSSQGPGPNGHNTFGLCTAYSSGSAQGQAEKQSNGVAFVALAAAATTWDASNDANESNEPSNETTQEKVAEYCAANGTQP